MLSGFGYSCSKDYNKDKLDIYGKIGMAGSLAGASLFYGGLYSINRKNKNKQNNFEEEDINELLGNTGALK